MTDESDLVSDIGFAGLRLRPGTVLRIQRYAIGSPESEIHFLGSVPGKIVMVTQKLEGGKKAEKLKPGEEYILHGFSGQYDFSFTSRVTQLLQSPFPYAALAYPGSVQARLVRRLARVKVSLPVLATPHGTSLAINATLVDMTVAGALLDSPAPLGKVGDLLRLEFQVDVADERQQMALAAIIRHAHFTIHGRYSVGLEFRDLSQSDRLVLHYIVHESADEQE